MAALEAAATLAASEAAAALAASEARVAALEAAAALAASKAAEALAASEAPGATAAKSSAVQAASGAASHFRSSFPITAPPAGTWCSASTAKRQAAVFRLDYDQAGTAPSACASSGWLAALRDADFSASVPGSPQHQRILVNVGANKGYVAVTMLALWRPSSGASAMDLYEFLRDKPINHENNRCGICRDCKEVVPPVPAGAPANAAALNDIVVYAVEPQPSNYGLLKGYASRLLAKGSQGALLPFHMGLFRVTVTARLKSVAWGTRGRRWATKTEETAHS